MDDRPIVLNSVVGVEPTFPILSSFNSTPIVITSFVMLIQKLVDRVGLEPTVPEASGLQSESDTSSQYDPLFGGTGRSRTHNVIRH